ncbi:MAG: sensor histidine kinase [Eubacterium sp.]|nr:sensor histidine kinase [Eubacterium sp.]
MAAFSALSISILLVLGVMVYVRVSASSGQDMIRSTQKLMEQTGENLEDYLVSMRQISDAVYYNVIKENDLSNQENSIRQGMNLLYEANRSRLRSIAIYNPYGSLVAAEPVALQKEDPDVTKQDWFVKAMGDTANLHFSIPHIQNLFDDDTKRYYWVISLSRVVELTDQGVPFTGVLLVDMDDTGISRMMKKINESNHGQYYYLCDGSGQIIYHNRQVQISKGIAYENSEKTARYKDGVYDDIFEGERRKVIVNTISYTGWKLVGIIPEATFTHGMRDIGYFIAMLILLMAMMLAVINRVISDRISSPILKLQRSVTEYEAGEKPEIYIGGSLEIRQLGYSIQRSYEQIDALMHKIVVEQNERRKSELDALQSQINPHFLYNALDSITWMIEGERNDDAVFMISQLAKLFRISLSKGRTVITVRDELQHAKSYMNIQKIRYKNHFTVVFEEDESIYDCCTVKLVLQPILENAINYGVGDMDGDGEIRVTARQENGIVILSVSDNGFGMTQEEVHLVLTDSSRIHKHGSGVGLVNVNNRIQILFGKEYGLSVESEPDEGTTVAIRIPAVPYTEESRKSLEKGRLFITSKVENKE